MSSHARAIAEKSPDTLKAFESLGDDLGTKLIGYMEDHGLSLDDAWDLIAASLSAEHERALFALMKTRQCDYDWAWECYRQWAIRQEAIAMGVQVGENLLAALFEYEFTGAQPF